MKQGKLLIDQNIDSEIERYYKWKESFIGKIEDWWDNFLGYKINKVVKGIKNLIRWFPIIWGDRDYDDYYIWVLLKQKIYFTCKEHIEKEHYVGYEREVEYMTTCIKLIDYIIEEHYNDLFHDEMEQKYGKSEWIFKSIPNTQKHKDLVELIFKYPKVEDGTYTQDQYDKEFKEGLNKSYARHNKAKKLLFRILQERIEHWWW